MWRDDATLLDIAQAARRVIAFVEGVDEASFIANAEKHWAVVAQLLVIGEAVRRLSANSQPLTLKSNGPGLPHAQPLHPWLRQDSVGTRLENGNRSRTEAADAD